MGRQFFILFLSKFGFLIKGFTLADFIMTGKQPLDSGDKFTIFAMGVISTSVQSLISHVGAGSKSQKVLDDFPIRFITSVSESRLKLPHTILAVGNRFSLFDCRSIKLIPYCLDFLLKVLAESICHFLSGRMSCFLCRTLFTTLNIAFWLPLHLLILFE